VPTYYANYSSTLRIELSIVLRYFYAGRLFISSVKPRAFKPTFQVNGFEVIVNSPIRF
jgi:hypothetical protein